MDDQCKNVLSSRLDLLGGVPVFFHCLDQEFIVAEMAPGWRGASVFFPYFDGAGEIVEKNAGTDVGAGDAG